MTTGVILFMPAYLGYMIAVVTSVIFTLSSHSLIFFWFGLELNMLAIVPVLVSACSLTASESAVKYFISQSAASVLYLASYFLGSVFPSLVTLTAVAVLFKLGLPPLHSWLVSVMMSGSYKIIFLVLVLQKFIPLHILANLQPPKGFFILIMGLTLIMTVSVLVSLSSLRVVLLISAWSNSGWLALATQASKIWCAYLAFYGLFLGCVMLVLNSSNNQKLSTLAGAPVLDKVSVILGFLNLGGLPPLSGFLLKLALLKYLGQSCQLSIIMLVLSLSLLSLYAYVSSSFYVLTGPVSLESMKVKSPNLQACFGLAMFASAFPVLGVMSM